MSPTAWILIGLAFWIITCMAILDIARKDFGTIQRKAAWAFAALVPFIGVLAYFIFGFRQGRPKRIAAHAAPRC